MDKKKAVKLATASAVAASAFVAANPHTSQAATDVATVVSQAKAKMKEAYYTYSHTVTETGKLPNISDVYAAYNKAKQAYANAVAVVNKAGGAKKDAYLADLQATYETYVFKANPKSGEARVATYIDAYKYAVKLDGLRQDLAKAVEAKDLKKAEELYRTISSELKKHTVIIGRVYGQSTRELLRSQFIAEAQKLHDRLIYDITVAMKAREAQDAVKAGNLDKAKAALDQVNQYVSKVTDAFKAELQKAAQDANAAYEAALTPKVESVSAINSKTLAVTFSKELTAEEKAKVTFEVKFNGNTALFKLDSYDGKVAKLVRTSNLAIEPGTYEVTVKGLGEDVTKTVVIEAQKASTLTITNENLLDATTTAKVGIELKDQYGEALSVKDTEFTVTGYNVTQGKTVTVAYDSTLKSFVVNTAANADDFKVGDIVKVSFLHNPTGLTATKELKVVAGAQLNNVTFGDVQLPTGKTMLTQDLTDVKVPYTATDQYGNKLELNKSASGNIIVVSSDETIVNPSDVTFVKEGTPEVTKVKIAKFLGYGKVTLTFVNKVTGDVYRLPLEVKQQTGVINSVSLEKSALDIAQGGSAVAVGLTVTDKYGNKIEPKNYASGSAFTISTSNSAVATATINKTPSSEDYGKLVVTPAVGATKGQKATITVTVNATGETARLNVTIGEPAVPSTIEIDTDSKHATSLAKGATTTVKYVVKDQYGNKVTTDSDSYAVKYEVKDNADFITVDNATDTDETAPSVVVTAAKAGSATLVAKLMKGSEVIATKELPISVVDNNGSKLTYAIEPIGTIYKGGSAIDTNASNLTPTDVAAGYAKEIKVTAKDANGNTVVIPADQILSVTTSNTIDSIVANVGGKWYVAGKNSGITEDKKTTISVVYNAEDGVKTLTQEVTISKDDLKVTSIAFKDKPVGATDAKDVTSLTVTNKAALKDVNGFGKVFVWAQDQFGGYTLADSKAEIDAALSIIALSGVTGAATDTIAVEDSTGLTGDLIYTDTGNDLAITADGAKLRLVVNYNGVAKSLDITVTNKD
ncbi:hypothetical protein P9851_06385 [Geobacillus stearothermophilus]|uniref:hypothetical protein n=1 Tax=Geobacillus stearothermophilus TaxID=1422 RepID=UPI002E1C1319|nr:hypothetical protein [Geobacillus stearothermophilus]